MKSVKWRAVLCSVGVLLIGALTAAAAEVVVAPPLKGTLYLETVPVKKMQFRWDPVAPDTDIIQKIVDKASITFPKKASDVCVLVLQTTIPVTAGLVTMSATGGAAGLTGDHIGVQGVGCGDINPGESLTIALSGALAGYQVFHTEINLEMRRRAVIQVDTAFGSDKHTFLIRSPGTPPLPASAPTGPVTQIVCLFEVGPNEPNFCRWKSDVMWDRATFKTLAGKVSIDGGSGGGSGTFSKFSLTKLDATLPCAPPAGGPPPVPVTASGPDDSQAILTRLQNSAPEETCKPIPVSLAWTEGENPVLQFFKDDLGQSVVTTFKITWPNEPAPAPVGSSGVLGSVPLSQQVFGLGAPLPIDLCVGTPVYVLQAGELVLESITPPGGGFPDLVPGGATQYGCAYERHITLPEEGIIGLLEFIYLKGDWGASRAFGAN